MVSMNGFTIYMGKETQRTIVNGHTFKVAWSSARYSVLDLSISKSMNQENSIFM